MSPLAIAWRNLNTQRVQTILTTLIIALGVGLAVMVIALSAGLRRGLIEAGGPFQVVIGPKGSATQLVVSSVLLQDIPIGNMSYEQYKTLLADHRLDHVIPIALGDNVKGLRIVGTTPLFFQVNIKPNDPPFYGLRAGRVFEADFEAVVGVLAAERLGVGVGDQIVSAHGALGGVNETEHEEHPYTVVGVIAPTGTPADLGIYVPLSSYWKTHVGLQSSIFQPTLLEAEIKDRYTDEQGDLGVTAVLIHARNISSAYQIYAETNNSPALQAALPGVVLTQFLNLLGQGEQVLTLVTYVTLAMALLSVILSLYGAVLARQRAIAVLRTLGASRIGVLEIALWEALLQGALGILTGLALGHLAASLVAWAVSRESGLAVLTRLEPAELPLLLTLLVLGVLAGLLPALRAFRLEPAQILAGPR